MAQLRTIRSFSVELMKLASGIQDADIQKLLAERRGEEYLPGGRLFTNVDEESTILPKMAGFTGAGVAASGNYDLKAKTKKDNAYQKGRDYAGTAIKGGLTGLGLLGAHNAMHGRFGTPAAGAATLQAARKARKAALVGSSVAVADRAYRHDELSKQSSVVANPNSSFRSPAAQLSTSGQTGSFHAGAVHAVGKAPKSFQIGNKFRLP